MKKRIEGKPGLTTEQLAAPVDELLGGVPLMYCEKYSCRMLPEACIARQQHAIGGARCTPGHTGMDPGCIDCEQGREVMAVHGGKTRRKRKERVKMETKIVTREKICTREDCRHAGVPLPIFDEARGRHNFYRNSSKDGYDSVCVDCRLRDKKANLEKRRRGAEASGPGAGQGASANGQGKAATIEATPKPAVASVLNIDFGRCQELLERIRAIAEDDCRTPEMQVLYWIKTMEVGTWQR